MDGNATRIFNLVEVGGVFALRTLGPAWIVATALAAGIALPDMPLLRHTYIAFALVLLLIVWLKVRGEELATFGLIAPRWLRYIGLGVLLAVVEIGFDNVLRQYTTPLIVEWTGANPHLDAETFSAIKGNLPLFLMIIPAVWAFAAFGEEFLYRGYLMTRLADFFGGSRVAWGLAIVGQAVAFGLAHWYQGPVGMVSIGAGAIITGIAVSAWGRNLWPAIVAHGLTDTLGFTLLYLGQPIN
jgi:membrane protease YdiL (CAAX protease family)